MLYYSIVFRKNLQTMHYIFPHLDEKRKFWESSRKISKVFKILLKKTAKTIVGFQNVLSAYT